MKTTGCESEHIDRLAAYREKITGEPATVELTREKYQELLDTVRELTERVEKLENERAPAKKPKAKPERPGFY